MTEPSPGASGLVDPTLAARVLERALARGGDFAELYAEARAGFALSLDDGRVERPQGGRELGACVRVVQGDSTYYGHVDGLAEQDLLRVAESASQARVGARRARAAGARRPASSRRGARRSDSAPRTSRRRARRSCCAPATSAPRGAGAEVAQVRVGLRGDAPAGEVFSSDGVRAADDRTRVRLSVQVVARRDGTRRDRQRDPRRPRGLRADRGATPSRWPRGAARRR